MCFMMTHETMHVSYLYFLGVRNRVRVLRQVIRSLVNLDHSLYVR